jgi:hypothetical protein
LMRIELTHRYKRAPYANIVTTRVRGMMRASVRNTSAQIAIPGIGSGHNDRGVSDRRALDQGASVRLPGVVPALKSMSMGINRRAGLYLVANSASGCFCSAAARTTTGSTPCCRPQCSTVWG